jgi:uncharacterized protein (DUF433 family)
MRPHDRRPLVSAEALRAELNPVGFVESLLVERLISTLGRLDDEGVGDRPEGRIAPLLDALRAARGLRSDAPAEGTNLPAPLAGAGGRAEAGREGRLEVRGRASSTAAPPPLPDLPPPGGRRPEKPSPASEDRTSGTAWANRLAFDPTISDRSPVVRGTWVTVAEVVSMVVDGWSWAEILRTHPELDEDDLRACLTYSVEEEGAGLACGH